MPGPVIFCMFCTFLGVLPVGGRGTDEASVDVRRMECKPDTWFYGKLDNTIHIVLQYGKVCGSAPVPIMDSQIFRISGSAC